MITIKLEGTSFELRNLLDELTIGEFEDISNYLNDAKTDSIDKWVNVFVYLGIPRDLIESVEIDDFITITKHFNNFQLEEGLEIVSSIEIEGKKYVAYEEKFKMTVKESGLIEGFIQKKGDKYVGDMMAVIYKLEGTERGIWYDPAHLKHKAELFRKFVTVDNAVPIISYLSKKLIKDVKLVESDGEV